MADLSVPDLDLTTQVPDSPHIVVHLAAAVPHAAGLADSEDMADRTRRMDANIRYACVQWGCPVIYASGCSLYDCCGLDRLTEEASLRDTADIPSPYLRAKLEGDQAFARLDKGTILRISAPIGPGLRKTTVLATFIERARNDEVLEVWGSGEREQDFIDVRDIGALITKIVECPQGGTYNVARGTPITMLELANTVVEAVGRGRVERLGRLDPNDQLPARYDIAKALWVFKWRLQIPLVQSIAELGEETFLN